MMDRREAMLSFGLALGSLAWGPFSRPALLLPRRKLLRAGMWVELIQGETARRFFLEDGVDHGRVRWSDLGFRGGPAHVRVWGALEAQMLEQDLLVDSTTMEIHYSTDPAWRVQAARPETRLLTVELG